MEFKKSEDGYGFEDPTKLDWSSEAVLSTRYVTDVVVNEPGGLVFGGNLKHASLRQIMRGERYMRPLPTENREVFEAALLKEVVEDRQSYIAHLKDRPLSEFSLKSYKIVNPPPFQIWELARVQWIVPKESRDGDGTRTVLPKVYQGDGWSVCNDGDGILAGLDCLYRYEDESEPDQTIETFSDELMGEIGISDKHLFVSLNDGSGMGTDLIYVWRRSDGMRVACISGGDGDLGPESLIHFCPGGFSWLKDFKGLEKRLLEVLAK